MPKARTPVCHVSHRDPCACYEPGKTEGPWTVCTCGAAYQMRAIAEFDFWRCPDCGCVWDTEKVRETAKRFENEPSRKRSESGT